MELSYIVAFLLGLLIAAWTPFHLFRAARGSRALKLIYVIAFTTCIIAAFQMTFRYIYYWDSNTRVHGWPFFCVIWQRKDANSQWLDFVGLISVLAFPLNFLVFLMPPSFLVLCTSWWQHRRKPNRVPVTDYESQPRVPHHRTYGSVSGGSARTRDKPA